MSFKTNESCPLCAWSEKMQYEWREWLVCRAYPPFILKRMRNGSDQGAPYPKYPAVNENNFCALFSEHRTGAMCMYCAQIQSDDGLYSCGRTGGRVSPTDGCAFAEIVHDAEKTARAQELEMSSGLDDVPF